MGSLQAAMVIAELAKSVSVTIQLVWSQVGFLYLVHKAMKKSIGDHSVAASIVHICP